MDITKIALGWDSSHTWATQLETSQYADKHTDDLPPLCFLKSQSKILTSTATSLFHYQQRKYNLSYVPFFLIVRLNAR